MAIPARNWPAVLDDLVWVTQPGGWIETVETWLTASDAHPNSRTVTEWIAELARRRGMDPAIARKIPEMMRARGLLHVTTYEIAHLLLQEGQRWKQVMLSLGFNALEDFRAQIIAHGITTTDEYDLVAARARVEVQQKGAMIWPAFVTYGQRPPLHS